MAHYDALQERLKNQHPHRDLPEYDATANVLSIKLDILRSHKPITSPPPLQQKVPGNNHSQVGNDNDPEESDEDVFEMRSLLPSSLRFLDLSSLQLKRVPPRLPLPLFLRPEYDYISKLVEKLPRSNAGCAIVSGQPGTGEDPCLSVPSDFNLDSWISRQDCVSPP